MILLILNNESEKKMQKCEGCSTVKCEYTNEYPKKDSYGLWWHSECLEVAMDEAVSNEAEYADYRRHHADPRTDNYSDGLNAEQRAWQEMKDAGWEF